MFRHALHLLVSCTGYATTPHRLAFCFYVSHEGRGWDVDESWAVHGSPWILLLVATCPPTETPSKPLAGCFVGVIVPLCTGII